MPGILGTEVARELRHQSNKMEIIFLTTSNEFAVDAFEVNAAHYLIKPFTQEAFHEAMDRAINHMEHLQVKMVSFKCPKDVVKAVEKDTICCIEGAAH